MRHPRSTLFPYTTLFRSIGRPARPIVLALVGLTLALDVRGGNLNAFGVALSFLAAVGLAVVIVVSSRVIGKGRSEEHTSELQSLRHLVCRLLLEKKNKHT